MDPKSKLSKGGPAVFFDRDGVINKVILRDDKPFSPRKPEEFIFNNGIQDIVSRLKANGYKAIVISNQPDLARGHITQETLDLMTERVKQEIPFDDVFICPHDDGDQCACRKPKPGMILEAAKKWKIDLRASYVIGDTWKDMEAGKTAGCTTILLDAVYNQNVPSDFRLKSLTEAAAVILTRK
jgi:D-glycero-D-manno-heptose 1,7-bisphosphate phosphatase